jgi:hypothetical protein
MNKKLETTVQTRAKREHVQQKVALLIARLTDKSGHSLLASEKTLIRRLDLKDEKWNPRYQIRQALRRLEKKGLVTCEKTRAGWAARLSPRGKKAAQKMEATEVIRIKKPDRWDGRWRIIIFDIWEHRRGMRDKLRRMLQKAGFYKLQGSIWIYPYDCEDLLVFLRADMHLGKSILYVIA